MNEILVGVDESEQSTAAVAWAAAEAGRAGARLRLVNVAGPWLLADSGDPRVREARSWLLQGGRDALERCAAHARSVAHDLEVRVGQLPGQPAGVLVEEGRGALMVVVGSHGAGRLTGVFLGSVASQIASHTAVPAVVVREQGSFSYGEVLVGVDGSPTSDRAIDVACAIAARRGARLRALLVFDEPLPVGGGALIPPVDEPDAADRERALAEALAGRQEHHPDLEIVQEVVAGRPARVLAGASARADLLVVGSRGRGGFTGLLLGSVGQAMLHRAHCPVAVVPPARH
ncbi:MSMEI_3859-like Universal stress protein [Actinomadura rubteroloni]|uniref:MSMEI_3859-like Universal stress protein n=1 Tax=Actinomadura rubteroloni TaxID=1926885 RepID=A0A2P4UQQ3_9ACTN|nr:universal stress protein [Actinomadura rubteroloni]POM27381.1 MSMEI_3859-like Universal stress protein [Actinomadura rubteroloni]